MTLINYNLQFFHRENGQLCIFSANQWMNPKILTTKHFIDQLIIPIVKKKHEKREEN